MLRRVLSLAIAAATFLGAFLWQYSFCETQSFSCIALVQTEMQDFPSTLRNKLSWGLDHRN